MSSEPLTKLRPSGISARQRTGPVWCVKVRTTVVELVDEKLKSLMVWSAQPLCETLRG